MSKIKDNIKDGVLTTEINIGKRSIDKGTGKLETKVCKHKHKWKTHHKASIDGNTSHGNAS